MKTVLLIGLDHFGVQIAKKMSALGHEVMAIDRDEGRVDAILPYVTDARIGDSTNENFLRSLGINNYDLCVVAIVNDFQSSLETTSLRKELGGKLVIARADRDVQAKFLLRNGADEVLNPEKQIAEWAAVRYASDHILDYIRLDDDQAIFEVSIPKDWIGKTIGQIDIRKRYGINIVALKEGGRTDLSFTPDTILNGRKTLLIIGKNSAILKCFRV